MPLDPVFDNDGSQPSWQMGLPLRITVHPASPPSPQADNSAASQGMESDGLPNDWIEPDGYPDDWIVPTDTRPAPQGIDNGIAPAKAAPGGSVPNGSIESDGDPNNRIEPDGYPDDWIVPTAARPAPQGIDNRIAPAKAAAGGSVPYSSIESDGYPNDWIEPDGYPDDWIVPAGARPAPQGIDNGIAPTRAATGGPVPYGSIESDGFPNDWIEPDGYPDDWIVPGQTRAPGIGFFGAGGPPPSSASSPFGLPQPQPQAGYGGSDAARPGDRAIPSAFQPSRSSLVVRVSDQAATRPGWIPLGPGSGWEPWADQFIKGMQGLINQFRSHSGGGAPRGGDGEDCHDRWEREDARCVKFRPWNDDWRFRACKERASERRNSCIRNGGRPDPKEPPEYDYRDFL
jgi:hypothetical protein